MKITPYEIKGALKCCGETPPKCVECPFDIKGRIGCKGNVNLEALKRIGRLEAENKQLQERICNQRRSLRILHAMYEWALSVLRKAKMNDRAKLQAWLKEKGYDLKAIEFPEPPKEGNEE